MLTTYPHIVPRSWEGRAIPLPSSGPVWPATGWNLTVPYKTVQVIVLLRVMPFRLVYRYRKSVTVLHWTKRQVHLDEGTPSVYPSVLLRPVGHSRTYKKSGPYIQLQNVIFLPTKSREMDRIIREVIHWACHGRLISILREWNNWSFFIAYLPDYTASHSVESDCKVAAIGPQILWKMLVPFTVPISVFGNNTELLVVTWGVSFFQHVDFYVCCAQPWCVMFCTCISSLYVLYLLSHLFLRLYI
jgi:hypothetical protein